MTTVRLVGTVGAKKRNRLNATKLKEYIFLCFNLRTAFCYRNGPFSSLLAVFGIPIAMNIALGILLAVKKIKSAGIKDPRRTGKIILLPGTLFFLTLPFILI